MGAEVSSAAKLARSAMRKVLEPHLAREGFVGKYPHFQRVEGDVLHLLSVVHDKYGGGFVLEFARMAPGPLATTWGQIVPQADLEIGYAPPDSRARLVRTEGGGGLYEDFFRYDEPGVDAAACRVLLDSVVDKFSQVNDWLRDGVVGANVSPFSA